MKVTFENIYKTKQCFIFLPCIGFDFEDKTLSIIFLIFDITIKFKDY